MVIKCEVCGAERFEESAVVRAGGDRPRHYCSARCADSDGTTLAPRTLPQRIVVAFDGSGPSLRALEAAAGLAQAAAGSVMLVHAIDMQGVSALRRLESGPDFIGRIAIEVEQALRQDAEAQLKPARAFLDRLELPYDEHIDVGSALDIIAKAATDADLVVVGSRGMGAFSGAILGSLSHRVVGAVACPVLIVH